MLRLNLKKIEQVIWKEKEGIAHGRQLFTGIPFATIGSKVLECQFGKDRKVKAKQKLRNVKPKNHGYCKARKKFFAQPTKKLNCPAKVYIREKARFPAHNVPDETASKELKKQMTDDILCRIRREHEVDFCIEYVLCLPGPDDHESHPVDDVAQPQPIDPEIRNKIRELTKDGVASVSEMKRHLHSFIREKYSPLPHPSNKRFYPSDKIISNHMYLSKGKVDGEQQNTLNKWVKVLPKYCL